jgi:hypothetical protein
MYFSKLDPELVMMRLLMMRRESFVRRERRDASPLAPH